MPCIDVSSLLFLAFVLLCDCCSHRFAQSMSIPISALFLGLFFIQTTEKNWLKGKREFSRPDFSFEELELAMQAYLNPFAKADVVLTLPGPDVEAGKARTRRGVCHDLSRASAGSESAVRQVPGGLREAQHGASPRLAVCHAAACRRSGFSAKKGSTTSAFLQAYCFPTGDVYTKLTVDLLRGFGDRRSDRHRRHHGRETVYATSARLMGFFPLDDDSDLEVGLSGYTGIHDPYNRDRFWYGNLDFKYKYSPMHTRRSWCRGSSCQYAHGCPGP